MIQCPRCNYQDYRNDINFCPRCQGPMSGPLFALPVGPPRNPLAPSSAYALAVPSNRFSNGNKEPSLQQVARKLYFSIEEVERHSPLWRITKHLAAYRAKEQAKAVYAGLVQIQQEEFLEAKRQAAMAEYARRQAQHFDAIRREQLMRQAGIFAEFLDTVMVILSHPRYADLPEETRDDMFNSLYRRAEEALFSAPYLPFNGYASPRDDNVVTIIEPDEF